MDLKKLRLGVRGSGSMCLDFRILALGGLPPVVLSIHSQATTGGRLQRRDRINALYTPYLIRHGPHIPFIYHLMITRLILKPYPHEYFPDTQGHYGGISMIIGAGASLLCSWDSIRLLNFRGLGCGQEKPSRFDALGFDSEEYSNPEDMQKWNPQKMSTLPH